ncbi:MAG: cupin domain-containing protein [Burkholderiales bacterium]|nr:cupin domain-containing protein [Burkholderiales bacterium]
MSAPAEAAFATLAAADALQVTAPDGSQVAVLLALRGGSMATFTLQPGQVSAAVTHRTVEELWYVVSGHGAMWRRSATQESITPLAPGLCLTVPLGAAFQFRCEGDAPLVAVAVTMPPWPGPDEAVAVAGPWPVST